MPNLSWPELKLDAVPRFSPASLGFASAAVEAIQKATAGLADAFWKAYAEVAKAWEEWECEVEANAYRLGELGWTYPVNLTIPNLRELVACKDTEELDTKLVEFYNFSEGEHFTELCGEILSSDHLIPWRPTLEECVFCHRNGKFNASATCLIAVLEGAITKEHGGRLKEKRLTSFFEARVKEAGDDHFQAAIWKSMAGFMRKLFESTDFSGAAPTRINRHWILHGKAIPNGSEADSLRLFQALHTISFIHDQLSREPSRSSRMRLKMASSAGSSTI
jgi:hypothetical protein